MIPSDGSSIRRPTPPSTTRRPSTPTPKPPTRAEKDDVYVPPPRPPSVAAPTAPTPKPPTRAEKDDVYVPPRPPATAAPTPPTPAPASAPAPAPSSGGGLFGAASNFFSGVQNAVQNTVAQVSTAANSVVHSVQNAAASAVQTVQVTANQALQTVQHNVATTVQTAEQKAAQVVNNIQDDAARIVDNIEQKVHTAEQTISSGVQNLQQEVRDTTQKVKDAVQPVVDIVTPIVKQGAAFVQATVDSVEQAAGITPTPAEPPVMHDDAGSVTYGPVQGQPFVDGVKPDDIEQGLTGDCYFLSSMASLAQHHSELFENNNIIQPNPDGTYTVTFHVPPGFGALQALGPTGGILQEGLLDTATTIANTFGTSIPMQTVQVTVDGDLPLDQNGNLQYVGNPQSELWPAIMEKAYAKLWGNYGAIGSGGDPSAAMRALTGGEVTHYSLDSNGVEPLVGVNVSANPNSTAQLDAIYDNVKDATDSQKMVVAVTYGANVAQPLNGIVGAHAYTVMGVEEENGQKYVVLRNPWGAQEPGNDAENDGVFRLTVDQFAQQFSGYDVGEVP